MSRLAVSDARSRLMKDEEVKEEKEKERDKRRRRQWWRVAGVNAPRRHDPDKQRRQ